MLSEVETLPEDTRKLVVHLHWDEDRDYGFLTSTFTNFYIPPLCYGSVQKPLLDRLTSFQSSTCSLYKPVQASHIDSI
jgi:hypothetical protein